MTKVVYRGEFRIANHQAHPCDADIIQIQRFIFEAKTDKAFNFRMEKIKPDFFQHNREFQFMATFMRCSGDSHSAIFHGFFYISAFIKNSHKICIRSIVLRVENCGLLKQIDRCVDISLHIAKGAKVVGSIGGRKNVHGFFQVFLRSGKILFFDTFHRLSVD